MSKKCIWRPNAKSMTWEKFLHSQSSVSVLTLFWQNMAQWYKHTSNNTASLMLFSTTKHAVRDCRLLWSSPSMPPSCRSPLLAIQYQKQRSSCLSCSTVLVYLLLKATVQASAEIIREAHSVSSLSALLSAFLFYLLFSSFVHRVDWVVEKQVDKGWSSHLRPSHTHTHTDTLCSDVWQDYL